MFRCDWCARDRMGEPARKLRNDRAKINQTHRYPHEKAADLLVFIRSDGPVGLNQICDPEPISTRLRVNRTNADRRERYKDSKNATRDAGAKKIKHGAGWRHSLVFTRCKNLSPENRA